MASGDMLLQLAGVVGESNDAKHKEFIELTSWSWGMMSPNDLSTGNVSGKAKVEDFKIIKKADRSSPVLIQYLKENVKMKTGHLIVRKAGGADPLTYYEIEFKNMRVSSFKTQAENYELVETVTFAFETANFKYTPQSGTGAKGGGVVEYLVNAYGPLGG
jgi:type VI secretion system secreted protein Hcp